MRPISLQTFALAIGLGAIGCSSAGGTSTESAFGSPAGAGGEQVAMGGAPLGGSVSGGGTDASGASVGSGGAPSSGGTATGGASMGGSVSTGGTVASGGTVSSGGTATGGVPTGGVATGGADTGGFGPTGGTATGGADTGGFGPTGGTATGGADTGGFGPTGGTATGGDGTGGDGTGGDGTGGSTTDVDCDAQMPTSGAQEHSATWAQGGSGNLAWQIWSNGSPGNLTTYDGVAAFRASWNNSGDYLGRMGFEWGGSGQQYTAYGTIKADYVWNKSGNAGGYSYLGIYGWSNNPCIEWYIVEDSFHTMPFNTGTQPSGEAVIDGGTYQLVLRHTSGTGGDRCGGVGSWDQYYSIRTEGKRCGTITVSDHFDVWAAKGWNLGNLLEVKIVVEAAGGVGSVDFPIANVTTSQ